MLHYKEIRTTMVLLANSKAVQAEGREELRKALSAAAARNFDLEDMEAAYVEEIYGVVDNQLAETALSEYEFVPELGSIRDHHACVAVCELCGKGDSKGDGTNEDKLRWDYKLTNQSGGADVWAGSRCIINHALKVRGADTSEEAREVLERAMREHMNWWRQQEWQAANPGHQAMRGDLEGIWSHQAGWSWTARQYNAELSLAGIGAQQDLNALWKQMRTVFKFYSRKGYLTEKKQATWEETKALNKRLDRFHETIEATKDVDSFSERLAKFSALASET